MTCAQMLTVGQLARAHALARAHGHTWGQLPLEDLPCDPEGIAALVDANERTDDRPLFGLLMPETVFYHQVGGGVAWSIYPDGTATLTLHAAEGGMPLAVVVDGHGRVIQRSVYTTNLTRADVAAMRTAVAAVIGESAADDVVEPWWAHCVDTKEPVS